MPDTLRLLLVEDNEADAELVELALRRGFSRMETLRVDRPETLRAALAEGQWDVVISDYSLPHMNAPEALELLKESGLDLPFIVVSGTIGEDTAVAMMRAGTDDYLMKDKLARLQPAIEHAIASARMRKAHRQAQQALLESEERYRSLYQAIIGGVVVESITGEILEANAVASAILGRTPEEMTNHVAVGIPWEAVHEDGTVFPRALHPTAVTLQTGEPVRDVTMGLPHPQTGELTWILVNSAPIIDAETGQVTAAVATFTDITSLKRVEENLRASEERFRTIFDRSAVGIVITGMDGKTLDSNEAMAQMLGLTREQYLNADPNLLVHPDDCASTPSLFEELLAGKRESYQREERLRHNDGHTVWTRVTVSLARFGPAAETVTISMVEDITAAKEAEQRLRESEERYRHMFEHMGSGVALYEVSNDGETITVRDWNTTAARLTRVSYEEVIGGNMRDLFAGATAMGLTESIQRVWRTGQPESLPVTRYEDERMNGWWENSIYRLPSGQVVCIFDDVSARVQAERLLHETGERLQAVVDAAPVAVAMLSREGEVLLWNPAAEHIFGWTEQEALTPGFLEEYDDKGLFRGLARQVMQEVRVNDRHEKIERKDGVEVDISISAGPVHDAEGNAVAAMGVIMDITERTRAAQLLRESEERFRRVYEETPIPYHSLGPDATMLEANPSWLQALGYSRDEVIGKPYVDFLAPELREEFCEHFEAAETRGELSGPEVTLLRRDGSRLIAQFQSRVSREADGSFRQTHCVFQDITARRAAEEALAAETERLAVTLRSIGDCVIATDMDCRVRLINPAAEQLTGWKEAEALGRQAKEVLNLAEGQPDHRHSDLVKWVLEEEQATELPLQTTLYTHDGHSRAVAVSAAPIRETDHVIGVVLAFRDVTEEQMLRAEALKAQKLESLGVLAGGIAHDFNNALLVINGNLQMARLFDHDEAKHSELLRNAERACMQARDLTQQLLTFAKGGSPVKKVMSISNLVRDTAQFAVSGSNARCNFEISPDTSPVEVDQGQISQVINNLVINADQAMPTGGQIVIRIANEYLDGNGKVPLPAGQYVCISVSDNGIGIPPEHLDRVFDPYFTTKSKGSGLGLASCYSIIAQHGGHLGVTSELGRGSTFSIYLPSSGCMACSDQSATAAVPGGSGRILIMDDEVPVRELAEMLLIELGYEVVGVGSGEEALAEYRRARVDGKSFAAVLLDLTVKGAMGGKEAILKLRTLDPEVRAIVCSGYSADPVMAQYEEYGFCAVVAKPYELADLAQAVARATQHERER